MITSKHVQIQGYDLHLLEVGTRQAAPSVLLLHGFAVSSEYWRPTLELLSSYGYHALALDILGFGESEKSDNAPYSLQLYADLCVGVLDHEGLEKVALVGHSFGGKLALATAIYYPRRVSRLVMMDADGFTRASSRLARKLVSFPKMREFMLWLVGRRLVIRKNLEISFYEPALYVTPELIERAHDALSAPDNQQVLYQMSRNSDNIDLHRSGLRLRLHEVRCPTLIVWGQHDRIFPAECARTANQEIPGSHLVLFPRCGHFPHLEAFRAFHGLLTGFLAHG